MVGRTGLSKTLSIVTEGLMLACGFFDLVPWITLGLCFDAQCWRWHVQHSQARMVVVVCSQYC